MRDPVDLEPDGPADAAPGVAAALDRGDPVVLADPRLRLGGVGRVGRARHASDLLQRRPPEEAARAQDHHGDQDHEDDRVGERRGDVADRERLGEADQEAADDRARQVADAADRRRR